MARRNADPLAFLHPPRTRDFDSQALFRVVDLVGSSRVNLLPYRVVPTWSTFHIMYECCKLNDPPKLLLSTEERHASAIAQHVESVHLFDLYEQDLLYEFRGAVRQDPLEGGSNGNAHSTLECSI